MSQFNFFDGAVAVVLLMGVIGGVRRGLSGELTRSLFAVLAVGAAWQFGDAVAREAQSRWNMDPNDAAIMGFLGVLCGTAALLWGLGLLLRNVIDFAFKGKTERMGGALLGVFHGAVIVLVALFIGCLIPNPSAQAWVFEKSYTGRLFVGTLRPQLENWAGRFQLRLPAPAPVGATAPSSSDGIPAATIYDEPAR